MIVECCLPASLFVSNIPMEYRTWLGRADNLFHSLAYEGSIETRMLKLKGSSDELNNLLQLTNKSSCLVQIEK